MLNIRQNGFTLIELMIVIAIIGILASIAIPNYMNYVGRSQAVEGFKVTSSLRHEIAAWVWEKKSFPSTDDVSNTGYIGKLTKDIDGKYVQDGGIVVIADTGVIQVNFDKGIIANTTLEITPSINLLTNQQVIQWSCGGSIDRIYLPTSCIN